MNCQADLLEALGTRLVVPLVQHDGSKAAARRLNPLFTVNGRQYVMATQLAAAVKQSELGEVVASLRDRSFDVVDALDMLITGV